MHSKELLKEINKLDKTDRITLVEEIWNSIAAESSELPLSQWQKRELSKRYNEYKSGSLKLVDPEITHKRLRSK
ncbi:MAG TPA: addiction module protein [Spirochaetota bacterium]|nr:addiction module protein [Spirochaetota bacterium]